MFSLKRIFKAVAALGPVLAGLLTLGPAGVSSEVIETQLPVGSASIYVRTVGSGRPAIVLHGGPDFDTSYLLPEMDRLQDAFRLIYYDQRGRGRSAQNVRAEDITLASDLEDLDRVRRHFGLESPILIGHSWGAVLALEYALGNPTHVSSLILMNPAPVSSADRALLRRAYVEQLGPDMDRQRTIVASPPYRAGDPETVAARYRIHFMHALERPEDYEKLMARMRDAFLRQGKAGILEARAVEDQLMRDTWDRPDYDLVSGLKKLRVPTLVITGDHDFIPVVISEHIAGAIPGGKLVTLRDCGHFAYLERPEDVHSALRDFLRAGDRTRLEGIKPRN